MTTTLNQDGSISTKAQGLLNELEHTARSMEIRSEALKNDQARLDTFLSTIKWSLTSVGSVIIVAALAVGFFGLKSIDDLKTDVVASSKTAVTQEMTRLSQDQVEFATIRARYLQLESDYETYRTWADALTTVATESEFGARDSSYAYEQVNEISLKGNPTQEDRLLALSLLESVIQSGTNGEADPNDLFNAAVSASRMGLHREASKLAVLAVYSRPSTSHRAFELQMQDLFGTAFTFDPATKTLIESEKPSQIIHEQAWGEPMTMLAQVPRVESEQAYSRASNVAVRNRSAGYYRQMIDVIEMSASAAPNQVTSYGYQTLAALYSWESGPDWGAGFWANVDLALQTLKTESPAASWVEHSARELLEEAGRIDQLPRLLEMAKMKDVDLVTLSDL